MPSINELSYELDIARDTVERGYKHLKNIGIIDSVPRRGYYIKNTEFRSPLKVFLLFNKLIFRHVYANNKAAKLRHLS